MHQISKQGFGIKNLTAYPWPHPDCAGRADEPADTAPFTMIGPDHVVFPGFAYRTEPAGFIADSARHTLAGIDNRPLHASKFLSFNDMRIQEQFEICGINITVYHHL
jgi:hypothetical protein